MNSPSCFISYARESDAHLLWVRGLAESLQQNGVFVRLDQWDLTPGADLTSYMESAIRDSDVVLLICTTAFCEKANVGRGGVGYEKTIVTGEIFNDEESSTKFVPVLREGTASQAIPSYLKSRVFVDFRSDAKRPRGLEELLRHIHSTPSHVRPPLGETPSFRGRQAKGDIQAPRRERSNFPRPSPGSSPQTEGAHAPSYNIGRFKELMTFAYETDGLDMSKADARQWAEQKLSETNVGPSSDEDT